MHPCNVSHGDDPWHIGSPLYDHRQSISAACTAATAVGAEMRRSEADE